MGWFAKLRLILFFRAWCSALILLRSSICSDRFPSRRFWSYSSKVRQDSLSIFEARFLKNAGVAFQKFLKAFVYRCNSFARGTTTALHLETNLFTRIRVADVKEKIVAGIDQLDVNLDGLLIHGDNIQSLNLLQRD